MSYPIKQFNTSIIGIESITNNNSDGFCIDTINEQIILEKDIKSISRITLSTASKLLDLYSALNDYYMSLSVAINIKIDYISSDLSINYKIHTIHHIANICLFDIKPNNHTTITSSIVDCDILNIDGDILTIYILCLSRVKI